MCDQTKIYNFLLFAHIQNVTFGTMGGHGHGDHGHHHHDPYTVPKASIYKIENAPQVLEVQQALAKRGLKDPWARLVVFLIIPVHKL